jgi:ribosomal protein S18 acetylase RimI-like enzyme
MASPAPNATLQSSSEVSNSRARAATAADLDQAAVVLADAFANDPVFCWLADRPIASTDLCPLFRAFVGLEVIHKKKTNGKSMGQDSISDESLVHIEHDGKAVALWRAPNRWVVPTRDLIGTLPAFWKSFTPRRFLPALQAFATVEKYHPKDLPPHYYLAALGTRTEYQGMGHGSAVIKKMLIVCDANRTPAYLECSNPASVPFYVRHGFVSRGVIKMPKGAPPVVGMWREPVAPTSVEFGHGCPSQPSF